ncbi:Pnap_2097 family protein [Paraburkholderia caballeronis]|uniref:Pnap_2097 family protein n=1 Tax=Paraburkholderia caballeronis TaxID=416943 RepID=UPI001066FEA0|nr:Pnap_2097 family protein [Paraburkholderia caballeronis]TDV11533.1 putative biosynthetic protein (TIGR04099 family) [Paraburkholderia caballeronis]TDV17460.1 putative biosynthetic protein (TIGR04099 family) [Paraburkholderia caballeronis]TDV27478.1 putative biosynthetic protein (TIGR04099 family) [Paraburkholderia caballeronis]
MAQHSRDRYRAGMPQLARNGLSENWLLKECGDRHWNALAAATGRAVPDFVDDDGERAYAAFTAVSVRDARLDRIGENDLFEIDTSLVRSGAARHFSEHWLLAGGALHARVSMCSAFVRRREAGNNQSVVRARFAALDAPVAATPDDALALARFGKLLRAGQWSDELGVARPLPLDGGDDAAVCFEPCPNSDFNGADFLYFASFQAFVDRAEWAARRVAEAPALARRDLFYHGNLNVGDTLAVRTVAQRTDGGELAHWCEIRRGSDREKIADVVTVKRWERP